VLREALDEYGQAVRVLQDAVQKLQAVQTTQDVGQASSRSATSEPAQQVQELEEAGQRDAAERASKADVAQVLKEVDSLRKDMQLASELANAKMEVGFAQTKADTALLRKDMEAMQNSLIIKLGGIMWCWHWGRARPS